MKKIALIHFAYPPNTGGVEVLIKEHALALSDLGYKVSVFAGSGQESNPKVKLTIIPELQSVMSFNPLLQQKILEQGIIDNEYYELVNRLEKLITTALTDQEVIIVHNMLTIVRNLPFISAFKKFVKKNPDKKYIAWTHDHSYINEYKIKDLDTIVKSKEELNLLTTPIPSVYYVAISESFKKPLIKLMNLAQSQVEVIPNGINLERFLEIDEAIWKIISSYRLLESFPVILAPVNILGRKNLEYNLDILFELKKSYKNSLLIITGSTSKHRSTVEYLHLLKLKIIKLKLDNNVLFVSEHFDRYLNESEIHDLYDLADVVFYFSRSENFGLPLLEAFLSRTPIFVSDLEVFHEIGQENINYIDYSKVLAQDAALIIKKFLESDPRVKAHQIARTKYNLKSILQEKLIPQLL